MNRRLFMVVAIVVAFLAIAPLAPRWLPVISTAITHLDFTAIGTTLAAVPEQLAAVAVAAPWLLPTLCGIVALMLVATLLRGVARRRGIRRATEAARREARATAAVTPAPAVAAPLAPARPVAAAPDLRFARPSAPAVSARAPVPVVAREPTATAPRRVTSGRSTAVRRLYADGRSVAEIARATGIGQDAVRAMRIGL